MSTRYESGRQPCAAFKAQVEANAYAAWGNVHECFGPYDAAGKVPGRSCSGTVSFCASCHSDHHSNGWQTCGEGESRG